MSKDSELTYFYDMIGDLAEDELLYLGKKLNKDLKQFRISHHIYSEDDIWRLPLSYRIRKEIYGEYKKLQTMKLMIYDECVLRDMESRSIRGMCPEKSMTNWDLSNDDYECAYNEMYTKILTRERDEEEKRDKDTEKGY